MQAVFFGRNADIVFGRNADIVRDIDTLRGLVAHNRQPAATCSFQSLRLPNIKEPSYRYIPLSLHRSRNLFEIGHGRNNARPIRQTDHFFDWAVQLA